MDPDLLAALAPVLWALRDLGVRHYVGGSIASSTHGVARSSLDADVVAELGSAHVSSLLARLADAYYVPANRVRDAVTRKTSFNVIHLETMLKVDVFVSKGRPADRRAFERCRPASTEASDELSIPVASAEDVILAKLDWYRRGGEVSERQWTDVRGVLDVVGEALDVGYLRRGALELEVGDLLERALAEAGGDAGPGRHGPR